MNMSEQENIVSEQSEPVETPQFENRYFVSVNANHYVNGMMIAFSQADADSYVAMDLAELTKEAFESVGQDSQLIDGKVVKGAPMVAELGTEAKREILAARLRDAMVTRQTMQDAVDLNMATDAEAASLPLWKKYCVLLNRVDVETEGMESWPQQPT